MTDSKPAGRSHGFGRRTFLERTAALGFAAAAMPFAGARAQEPKRGGELRLGMAETGPAESLNPATMSTAVDFNVTMGQLRNALVEIDAAGNAIPELATGWEPSADAAKWTFAIRDGVDFHDGKRMTAEDVIYSINYHRDDASQSAVKPLLAGIKEIRADGKNVVFELEAGNADFPYILSDYHMQIFPAGTQAGDFIKGIGTGGYVLESFEPGVQARTVRNSNYWKEGRAHFDSIHTIGINDAIARTTALQGRSIDVMNRPDLKMLGLLAQMPGIEVADAKSKRHFTLPMRTISDPYSNNDVRLALKYLVDREDLLNRILQGHGELGNDTPINSSYRYFNPDLPQTAYDPDKALFHLRKAGLENTTFQLHASNAPFAEALDVALLVSEHAKRAGVTIEVVRASDATFWDETWKQVGWTLGQWFGRPTEDMMFTLGYQTGGDWNETYWSNARFDELLLQARSELDDERRRAMYYEMQQIMHDEGGMIAPLFTNQATAHSDALGHGEVAGNAELDGLRIAERWWFK